MTWFYCCHLVHNFFHWPRALSISDATDVFNVARLSPCYRCLSTIFSVGVRPSDSSNISWVILTFPHSRWRSGLVYLFGSICVIHHCYHSSHFRNKLAQRHLRIAETAQVRNVEVQAEWRIAYVFLTSFLPTIDWLKSFLLSASSNAQR